MFILERNDWVCHYLVLLKMDIFLLNALLFNMLSDIARKTLNVVVIF